MNYSPNPYRAKALADLYMQENHLSAARPSAFDPASVTGWLQNRVASAVADLVTTRSAQLPVASKELHLQRCQDDARLASEVAQTVAAGLNLPSVPGNRSIGSDDLSAEIAAMSADEYAAARRQLGFATDTGGWMNHNGTAHPSVTLDRRERAQEWRGIRRGLGIGSRYGTTDPVFDGSQ